MLKDFFKKKNCFHENVLYRNFDLRNLLQKKSPLQKLLQKECLKKNASAKNNKTLQQILHRRFNSTKNCFKENLILHILLRKIVFKKNISLQTHFSPTNLLQKNASKKICFKNRFKCFFFLKIAFQRILFKENAFENLKGKFGSTTN